MGQVYYDMGFLSSVEVVECSASDLVGQYVGQTGPKTRQVFERALGKVLFIDEAYRLSEGAFAKEAMDELTGILTQEAFIGKLIVVIAGYDKEMNALLASNPGLASRFPEELHFDNMSPEDCLEILKKDLAQEDIECAALGARRSTAYKQMVRLVAQLSALDSWGNARDMKTLAKQMVRVAFRRVASGPSGSKLPLSDRDAVSCIAAMLEERVARATNLPSAFRTRDTLPVQHLDAPKAHAPKISTARATRTTTRKTKPTPQQDGAPPASEGRDPGVSDAVWTQLKADKRTALEAARRRKEELRALEQAARGARSATAREQKERELEVRRQKELEEERKERRAQEKLREMGVCPAGYEWHKQTGGYRCDGGSHWVSDSELGM